jgi:hypothetical protein
MPARKFCSPAARVAFLDRAMRHPDPQRPRHVNHYCSGADCRRTTRRVRVRLDSRTYLYCVRCGRRLDVIAEHGIDPLGG